MSKDKESIQVTIRVRPLSDRQLEEDSRVCLKVQQASNLISMHGLNGQKQGKDFIFDSVCDRTTQDQIFNKVGLRSTAFCMEGYNCTIFAYGQTGAGKTFTMMGVNPENKNYHELRGLIPRTLEYLFENIENQIAETGVDYMIKCSFVQIYNQQIIDLLGNGNSALNIRQDIKKGVYMEGVTQQLISRSEQAMEILRKGSKGRHVGSTCYNEASSRSHSVFTMQIQSQSNCNGVKSTKSRHFHFIDLAGSERTKKSAGQRLKQGCSINKSLHVLSTVIGSLAQVSEGKARHINYRDSKLTFLLKDSLGGNSKTHLIANVSPSWISSHETRSTLIFARKVKLIKVNKASINEDSSGNLDSLKAQIKRLKSQIIILRNQNGSQSPFQQISHTNSSCISRPNNGNHDGKMVKMLQQYVDQELEKQTKLEIQLNKMINKSEHLQRGIKHFSDNQKQLRMIIAIYEDKLKRMASLNQKWLNRFEQLSQQQKMVALEQYFINERQQLVAQNEQYKKITPSVTFVRKLLKQLKIYKETDEKDNGNSLVQALQRNNQFLKQIKITVQNAEPLAQNGQTQKQIAKQQKQLKEQNRILNENNERQTVQIAQFKDKVEEYETLLEEAIKTQIQVEKNLQQNQQNFKSILQQKQKQISLLVEEKQGLKQQIQQKSEQNQHLEVECRQNKARIEQITNQYKQQTKKNEQNAKLVEQKMQNLHQKLQKVEQSLKQRIQENKLLKNKTLQIETEADKNRENSQNQINQLQLKNKELSQTIHELDSDKTDLKIKLDNIRKNMENQILQKDSIVNQLNKRIQQLSKKNTNLQDSLNQQHVFNKNIQEKISMQDQLHQQEKQKWQENQKQLIGMINKKQENDTEISGKLKQAQLQLIDLHQKYGQLQSNSKKQLELTKQQNHSQSLKLLECEQKLIKKMKESEQISLELTHHKQQVYELTQKLNTEKRANKNLEEDMHDRDSSIQRLKEEIEKIKNRQRQSKVIYNEQKNEAYALKKKNEIEIKNLQQKISDLEDALNVKEKQLTKAKQNMQDKLTEAQKQLQNQMQIAKNNQVFLKNTMEANLDKKQAQIVAIKQQFSKLNDLRLTHQRQIKQLQDQISQILSQSQQKSNQILIISRQLEQKQQICTKTQQQLEQIQMCKIKEIDELQNKYTDEIDEKNAEIINLQIKQEQDEQVRAKLQQNIERLEQKIREIELERGKLQKLSEQAIDVQKQLKQQIINLKEKIDNETKQKEEINDIKDKIETELQKLQTQLLQTQQHKMQISSKLQQQNHQSSQQILKLKQSMKLKQQKMRQLELQLQSSLSELQTYISVQSDLEKTINKLQQQISNKNQQYQILTNNLYCAQQKNKQLSSSIGQLQQYKNNLQAKYGQLSANYKQQELQIIQLKQIASNKDNTLKQLQLMKLQTDMSSQESQKRLLSQINELQSQAQILKTQNNELKTKYEHNMSVNIISQQKISALQLQIDNKNQRINQLLINLDSYNKKNVQMQNQALKFTNQIDQLNNLYESLKIQKKACQNTIQNLHQDIMQMEKTISQNQDQIENFKQQFNHMRAQIKKTQEQKSVLQSTFDQNQKEQAQIYEKYSEFKEKYHQLYKQKQETSQALTNSIDQLHNQLKFSLNQAETWKQRTQNLQNQVRLANQRADKFKKDLNKQKQMNYNLKNLIQNSEGQINQYKLEVQQKQLQYKKLLQKLARYDNERKGLATQDRRASQLLEKSRIQVTQFKKKYEDQIKINKILKQQLEKKQIDSSIIKQRAEQYCKKQNEVTKSIQANYDKQQREFNNQKRKYQAKIQELQLRYNEIVIDNKELQDKNIDLKKDMLKGSYDDKNLNIVNRYKQQNSQLRREIEKVKEHLLSETQQKIKLKTEINKFRDLNGSSSDTMMIEISKKNSEIKHLQKILDDSMQALQIRDYKKLSSDSLKFAINQLQLKLSKTNSENQKLESELEIKTRKLQIYEKQSRIRGNSKQKQMSQEEGLSTNMSKYKAKIQKCSSTFQAMRQAREDQSRTILQSKDSNKGAWGISKY